VSRIFLHIKLKNSLSVIFFLFSVRDSASPPIKYLKLPSFLEEVAGQFRDSQIKGLFSSWTHTHLFNSLKLSSSILDDHIEYSLPGGILTERIVSPLMNKKLNQMFDYRHRLTIEDLLIHAIANKIRGNGRPMTIGITGSSGFIGS
jgi:hypothetical protein